PRFRRRPMVVAGTPRTPIPPTPPRGPSRSPRRVTTRRSAREAARNATEALIPRCQGRVTASPGIAVVVAHRLASRGLIVPQTWTETAPAGARPATMSAATRRAALSWPAAWLLDCRLIPFLLAAVTFLVFSPALLNGFVIWDDQVNFLQNPGYRG